MRVAVLLADSDTGATMLLEKLFTPAPDEAGRLAETVARRQMAPGLPVAGTGRGQIVTSVGRRRADGLLALGSGAGGRTVLNPRDAVMNFVAPLGVADAADLASRFAGRAPGYLRPRRRIHDVHVFAVEEVLGQAWDPGSQLWQAAVKLASGGGTLYLERPYDAGAPGALDSLAAALDGRSGPLRQVSGTVRVEGGALVCEPWSLGADRFIVPDLDRMQGGEVPREMTSASAPLSTLDEVARLLAGAVHAGRRTRDERMRGQGSALAERLKADGYPQTASHLAAWLESAPDDPVPFGRCAVWLATLREGDGQSDLGSE